MSEQLSNLMSRQYCQKCGSFDLKRIHRGFFKKAILHSPMEFKCHECGELTNEAKISRQELKQVPLFFERT